MKFVTLVAVAVLAAGTAAASELESDRGLCIGFTMTGGWRQMDSGKDEDNVDWISESVYTSHWELATVSWGFSGGMYRVEPTLYLGSATGRVDGGRRDRKSGV